MDIGKGISGILKLAAIRLQQWWHYLVPFYLGIIYLSILIFNLDFYDALLPSILLLFSTIFTILFAYLLNDYTDRHMDIRSGRGSATEKYSLGAFRSAIAIALAMSALPWIFLPASLINISLYLLQIIVLVLYSMPPFRLKEKAVPAVLLDASYNSLIFTFFIIYTMSLVSADFRGIGYVAAISGAGVLLMKGLRGIILHMVKDRKFDNRAGVNTFVVRLGPMFSLRLISGILVPLEVILLILFCLMIDDRVPGMVFLIAGFILFSILRYEVWEISRGKINRHRMKAAYFMNDFYEGWLPLFLIIYLSVIQPLFLIVLIIHIIIDQKELKRFVRDCIDIYNKLISGVIAEKLRYCYTLARLEILRIKKYLGQTAGKSGGTFRAVEGVFYEYNRNRMHGPKLYACHAPMTSVFFRSDGRIIPCCYNHVFEYGRYPEDGLDKVLFAEKRNELKQAMKNWDFSEGCQFCESRIREGNFKSAGSYHYDHLQWKKRPTRMEFELDITCNLECIMCNGNYSSSIRRNREKRPDYLSPYTESFVDEITPYLGELQEAKFTGGEPFVSELYFRIWERIIQQNPHCIISIQTNATVLNEKVKRTMEEGNFKIGVSMDAITKATFEKVRRNASFESVMQNIDYFHSYSTRRGISMTFSFCPITLNWKEIPGFINYCNERGAEVFFNTVISPVHLSLRYLQPEYLDEIESYLSLFRPETKNAFSNDNYQKLQHLISQIKEWSKLNKINSEHYTRVHTMSRIEILDALLEEVLDHAESKNMGSKEDNRQALENVWEKLVGIMKSFTDEQVMLFYKVILFNTYYLELYHLLVTSDVETLKYEISQLISSGISYEEIKQSQ